jgi:hypothetical protein
MFKSAAARDESGDYTVILAVEQRHFSSYEPIQLVTN